MKYTTLLALLLLACSSTKKHTQAEFPDAELDEEKYDEGPSSDSVPRCEERGGEPVECDSDDQCCPEFYCGIDPEGSTRIRVCIYGGG
ncbi:hypothetical protein ACFL5O_06790 [Myxococcota bacterium]